MKDVIFIRTIFIIFGLALVGYIVFSNTVPFGIGRYYSSSNGSISALGPASRVQTMDGVTKQMDNFAYFYSAAPFKFDNASVTVTYKNSASDQQVLLGYKDQDKWHYNTEALSAPFIDGLNWQKIGSGPYLYQKTADYQSVQSMLDKPPENKIIGVYKYANSGTLYPDVKLPNYTPSNSDTTITPYLRGKTTFYAYASGEKFHMSFTKQDLNWYSDPDVMNINIYKDGDKVYDATIDDDGNSKADQKVGAPQTATIDNPGPGLPEPGVYKIVVDAPPDAILTKISTNLHKIAFEGPISTAANSANYPGLVEKTQPLNIFTNALNLTAQTFHATSLQAISSGTQSVKITKAQAIVPVKFTSDTTPYKITAPLNDVILNGVGYFAFSPEQFFEPSPYKILPINDSQDTGQVDYVLTDYPGANNVSGGWKTTQLNFNLSDAVMQRGKLSWIVEAPALKTNGNTIQIKNIEMTLTKQGWLK